MSIHKNLPYTDSHFAHSYEYADAAARTGASGFVASDVNRLALQLDNNSLWLLTSTTPTWMEITSVASGTNEIVKGTTAPGDTSKYWVDTTTSPATWKYYDGTSWVAFAGGSGSGGGGSISDIDIRPSQMRLDDVATGADNGVVWSLFDTIDFDPDNDGAVWCSFKFPDGWDDTKDIDLTFKYTCNGNDQGKSIIFNTSAWAVEVGDTPTIGSPDSSNVDTIGTSSSNIDKMSSVQLSNGKVPAAALTSNTDTVIIRFTRDADNASDNYTGTFQLLSVLANQS
jgi:hypothetical protein